MPEVVYFVFGAHYDDWHWEHRVYESEEDAQRAADIMAGNDDLGYKYSVCEMTVVPALAAEKGDDHE